MARLFSLFAVLIALVVAALPAQAAPLSAYGRLPAIEKMRLSPSGDRVAFIAVVGDQRRLIVKGTDGKTLSAVTVGDTKVRAIDWAGEDHVVVAIGTTSRLGEDFTISQSEFVNYVVLDLRSGGAINVFQGHKEVSEVVAGYYGAAEEDGHWFGYFGGITLHNTGRDYQLDHTWSDIYRVDLDTGAIRLSAHGDEQTRDWVLDAKGAPIARLFYNDQSGAWRVEAQPGGKVLAKGVSATAAAHLIGLGRGPNSILISRPGDDGTKVDEVNLDGQVLQTLDAEPIKEFLSDPVTHLWIGEVKDDDDLDAVFLPSLLEARMRGARKAFPKARVELASYSTALNHLIVHTNGADDAGTYWLVDIATGAADPVGSDYPDVKPEEVGSVRMVEYKAADGLTIHGVLTLPPGKADAKSLPVVVLPHGGPVSRDYPDFDWWAQAYASRGYAVLQPNFRGSDGYGLKFRQAGIGEWGRKMQTDISDGLAYLAKEGIVDPKRACIVGASYGGYAALAGVTLQHGLYRCAVAVAPVSDLGDFFAFAKNRSGNVSPETRYWRIIMGDRSDYPDISPLKQAEHADAPILLIHGKDDTTVPYAQSQSMASALPRYKKPVELVTLAGEDHYLSKEETRKAMLESAVAFVIKNNPPDAAP